MAKSETTKSLEKLLLTKFNARSDFFVFECTIGWYGSEIVDCISYNCSREFTCYEIKSSVADFHSKAAKTFIGNKNYFVMPYSVWKAVQNEIAKNVGVYVAVGGYEEIKRNITGGTETHYEYYDGFNNLICMQNAKRVEIGADREIILSSMLRCMQRDFIRGNKFAYNNEV